MMRMLKMELVVFSRYIKQLMFTMAFTMCCVVAGMGTISGMPSIAFIMMMFSLSMSGAAYDEQNAWGVFRMTMPVSRRDVVLGRYVFNLLMASAAAAVAAVVMGALAALGSTLPTQGFFADLLAWNDEATVAALAGMVSCACIGLALNSVSLPVYFKFGQTKATQWLPFIMLLLSVLPFLAFGFIVEFAGGQPMTVLEQLMGSVQDPGGLGLVGLGALAVAFIAYWLSALVSIKLYGSRDL